jgi:hypothetical protein
MLSPFAIGLLPISLGVGWALIVEAVEGEAPGCGVLAFVVLYLRSATRVWLFGLAVLIGLRERGGATRGGKRRPITPLASDSCQEEAGMIVDRIEGAVAVVEAEKGTVDLPVAWLPTGAREGSVLCAEVERKAESSRVNPHAGSQGHRRPRGGDASPAGFAARKGRQVTSRSSIRPVRALLSTGLLFAVASIGLALAPGNGPSAAARADRANRHRGGPRAAFPGRRPGGCRPDPCTGRTIGAIRWGARR